MRSPITLAGRRSGLYAALSGFSYVRYEWFARLAQPSSRGTPAHSPALGSVVAPAAKAVDIDQPESVISRTSNSSARHSPLRHLKPKPRLPVHSRARLHVETRHAKQGQTADNDRHRREVTRRSRSLRSVATQLCLRPGALTGCSYPLQRRTGGHSPIPGPRPIQTGFEASSEAARLRARLRGWPRDWQPSRPLSFATCRVRCLGSPTDRLTVR